MLACRDRNLPVLRYLLKLSGQIELEKENNEGDTAISIACKRGYTEITRTLVTNGAQKQVRDKVELSVSLALLIPLEWIFTFHVSLDEWGC